MDISDADKAELECLIVKWLKNKRCLSLRETLVVDLKVVRQAPVKINVIQSEVDHEVLIELAKTPVSNLSNIIRPGAEENLRNRGISTLGEVLPLGYWGLLKTRNLVRLSVKKIRERLRGMGFKLGREWMVNSRGKWVPDPFTTSIK